MTGRKPLSDAAGEGDPVNPPPETMRPDDADTSDRTDKTLTGAELLALAEATGQLPPDPFPVWTDPSGHEHAVNPRPGLVAAALHGSLADFKLDPVALVTEARWIVMASLHAADKEARSEQPATIEQTTRALSELERACGLVEAALDQLQRPAVAVIEGQLYIRSQNAGAPIGAAHSWMLGSAWHVVSELRNSARDGIDAARRGTAHGPALFGSSWPVAFLDRPMGGRPRKHTASDVCYRTAAAFWRLTRRRPTLTTDPVTNRAAGLWVETLQAVFEALNISASAEAQARELRAQLRGRSCRAAFDHEWLDFYS
jgi:hypothetical protein